MAFILRFNYKSITREENYSDPSLIFYCSTTAIFLFKKHNS